MFKAIDNLAVKNREFNVSVTGMSAGGALMATSIFWGFWAYSSVPKLDLAGNIIKIADQPGTSKLNADQLSPIVTSGKDVRPNWASMTAGTVVYDKSNERVGKVNWILIDENAKPVGAVIELGSFAPKKVKILLGGQNLEYTGDKFVTSITKPQLKATATQE